jgi:para-nitrobenzyl esterase
VDDTCIEIASGIVRGTRTGPVYAFKGIPYGADTSGVGRFRPPRPPQPWSGVRDCMAYGPSSPQMSIEQMTGTPMPAEAEQLMGVLACERRMSEDCLVLNVWTPSRDSQAKLPVLVWLHGGAWNVGSASWPLYDFTNLAAHGDVVVVGVNHRLGILGFLDLSALDPDYATSGNVSLLDVVASLGWVRDNIAAFGGDPANVTVFGESGGGLKVTALMGMPDAASLFHKAFAMSGSRLNALSPDRARRTTKAVIEHLGVSDISDLQAVPFERLLDAELRLGGRTVSVEAVAHSFSPVLNPSLPERPEDAVRGGSSAAVAFVGGCTTHEMLAFLRDPGLWVMSWADVISRTDALVGGHADAIVAAYRDAAPDETPPSALISILTDALYRVPHIRMAEAQLLAGGSTWLYLFGFGQAGPDGHIRSAHGSDMPLFFDNVDKAPASDGPHAGSLVASMSGALLALARDGAPAHRALPAWPTYSVDHRPTMWLDVESELRLDPGGAQRACWEGIFLLGFGD